MESIMPDKGRWRWGDTLRKMMPVQSLVVIEIGDLLCCRDGHVYPASQILRHASQSYPATIHQELFGAKFAGVAMQRSRSGGAKEIAVATAGIFVFDCSRGKFEFGDLVGPRPWTTFVGSLHNQCVAPVATAERAIGRVAKQRPLPVAEVLVNISGMTMDTKAESKETT